MEKKMKKLLVAVAYLSLVGCGGGSSGSDGGNPTSVISSSSVVASSNSISSVIKSSSSSSSSIITSAQLSLCEDVPFNFTLEPSVSRPESYKCMIGLLSGKVLPELVTPCELEIFS